MGGFIADFCCLAVKIIIEIDGDTHVEQQEYDDARTVALERLGYRVMRFTNSDVLHDIEA